MQRWYASPQALHARSCGQRALKLLLSVARREVNRPDARRLLKATETATIRVASPPDFFLLIG
jgi:hypothetical protein